MGEPKEIPPESPILPNMVNKMEVAAFARREDTTGFNTEETEETEETEVNGGGEKRNHGAHEGHEEARRKGGALPFLPEIEIRMRRGGERLPILPESTNRLPFLPRIAILVADSAAIREYGVAATSGQRTERGINAQDTGGRDASGIEAVADSAGIADAVADSAGIADAVADSAEK